MHNIITSFLNNHKDNNKQTDIKTERENFILNYSCKFIDKLSFNSIIRDKHVQSLLPKPLIDKVPLKLYYKYSSPIRKDLLN